MENDPTPEFEAAAVKWRNRIARLVKDIPKDLVVLVNHGHLSFHHEGELRAYEATNGHRDAPPEVVASVASRSFEPNSESL